MDNIKTDRNKGHLSVTPFIKNQEAVPPALYPKDIFSLFFSASSEQVIYVSPAYLCVLSLKRSLI